MIVVCSGDLHRYIMCTNIPSACITTDTTSAICTLVPEPPEPTTNYTQSTPYKDSNIQCLLHGSSRYRAIGLDRDIALDADALWYFRLSLWAIGLWEKCVSITAPAVSHSTRPNTPISSTILTICSLSVQTCLLARYLKHEFPKQYIPTMWAPTPTSTPGWGWVWLQ